MKEIVSKTPAVGNDPPEQMKGNDPVKSDPFAESWNDLALSYYAIMGGYRVIYDPKHPDGAAPAQEGQQEHPRPGGELAASAAVRAKGELAASAAVRAKGEPAASAASGTGSRNAPSNDHDISPQGDDKKHNSPPAHQYSGSHGFLTRRYRNFINEDQAYEWSAVDPKTNQAAGTLTPHGVLWMAEKKWLPFVSPAFVKDKSQVNALAKVLVCFQAGWMILQTLVRVVARQPVTLLELHTVLHALCAATMYITVCCSCTILERMKLTISVVVEEAFRHRPPN